MTFSAPAKLNLALDVLSPRPDGYHELLTVMQTADLCDIVTVLPSRDGEPRAVSNRPELPADGSNLALAAALLFRENTGFPAYMPSVLLRKHIPAGAGLGGGSADAAAVLRGLRRESGADISDKLLLSWAAELGSDVPFCLFGGTQLAGGRGELLTPLPPLPDCFIVICCPGIAVRTGAAFARLDNTERRRKPDISGLCEALRKGDLALAARYMCNVFDDCPGAAQSHAKTAKSRLARGGALGASMSGSGSAVFGVFADCRAACAACAALRREYAQTYLCRPVPARRPESRG
ncbi:MAG: 4-(cytidine 5'-diphospho)-2-C-methyl-D-erythritol kinase [Oscillospiraceae bacterium]|jgi:4-diphosphocytidyl-2-C-methyl-D-erythritol kinase|nr:4-(cytidine 5'-diphospho)-2-C-methyl-D-erythritol kinase [Oscillospiraceae bacterium]